MLYSLRKNIITENNTDMMRAIFDVYIEQLTEKNLILHFII